MSKTLSLSIAYGSFFWGCAKFAVSPYTATFLAIANPNEHHGEELLTNVAAAAVVCGVLTFVFPVLPILTSFTSTLASIAMLLAVATMFATYPIAVITDTLSADRSADRGYSAYEHYA